MTWILLHCTPLGPRATLKRYAVQGATAMDPVEGDVSLSIDACAVDYRFQRYGLLACSFSTAAPGTFRIPFYIRDSATGARASVARTLIVMEKCYLGEVPCSGGGCSQGGACLSGAPVAPPANAAPQLTLAPGGTQRVYVPYGKGYSACTDADVALRRLCEPGMLAMDAEDGVLTRRVLSCPPSDCLVYGCPGHEFSVKGVAHIAAHGRRVLGRELLWSVQPAAESCAQCSTCYLGAGASPNSVFMQAASCVGLQGCGVATGTAGVGSQFNVTFVVFDSNMPAASAMYTKTISVISPCTFSQVFCPNKVPVCGAGPCLLRTQPELTTPVAPPAVIDTSHLPAGSWQATASGIEVRAVCGCAPPISLAVCAADDARPGCFVRAQNTSAVLAQQDVDSCAAKDAESGACALCTAATLQRRTCRASSQRFEYLAARSGGALQRVHVTVTERVAQASGNFTVTLPMLAAANATVFAGGAAADSYLAAAVQSAARRHMLTQTGSAGACAFPIADTLAGAALCVVSNVSSVSAAVNQSAVSLQLTLALGAALGGSSADQVHAAVPADTAQTCLVHALEEGLNTSSIAAALADLGSNQNISAWLSTTGGSGGGGVGSGVQSSPGRCNAVSKEQAQELWLEATTDALQTGMLLLEVQVSCALQLSTLAATYASIAPIPGQRVVATLRSAHLSLVAHEQPLLHCRGNSA
jgi:hypothetical protein